MKGEEVRRILGDVLEPSTRTPTPRSISSIPTATGRNCSLSIRNWIFVEDAQGTLLLDLAGNGQDAWCMIHEHY